MLIPKAAKRYAHAWYKRAHDDGKLEEVLKDSRLIYQTVNGSRELQLLLKNQVISGKKKKNALEAVFSGSVGKTTTELINLLLSKRREELLGAVAYALTDIYNEEHGIIDVEVRFTSEPDNKQKEALKKALEKRTGKTVILRFEEDQKIIGGLTIRIGDTVIDGSVRNKIRQLDALFHGTAA